MSLSLNENQKQELIKVLNPNFKTYNRKIKKKSKEPKESKTGRDLNKLNIWNYLKSKGLPLRFYPHYKVCDMICECIMKDELNDLINVLNSRWQNKILKILIKCN